MGRVQEHRISTGCSLKDKRGRVGKCVLLYFFRRSPRRPRVMPAQRHATPRGPRSPIEAEHRHGNNRSEPSDSSPLGPLPPLCPLGCTDTLMLTHTATMRKIGGKGACCCSRAGVRVSTEGSTPPRNHPPPPPPPPPPPTRQGHKQVTAAMVIIAGAAA